VLKNGEKHGSVPNLHTCSGLDSHNEQKHWHSKCHYKQNSGSTSAGRNNPTRLGRPAEQQKTDERLVVARPSSGDDDDFCSGGGRTTAAMTSGRMLLLGGPRPCPQPERQGRAEGRRVGGRSAGGAGKLVGGGTSSSCRGGRRHRERLRSRSAQRAGHAAAAHAVNGECPSPPITEGRSGPPPTQGPTPTWHTPLPSLGDENP
jgi:hypothetical protein